MQKTYVRLLLITLLLVVTGTAGYADDYVFPEVYGAVGDGQHDDTPAFNQCFSQGKGVKLKIGRRYRFISKMQAVPYDKMLLDGNGAEIIIDGAYPSKQWDEIFRFKRDSYNNEAKIEDVKISCLLPARFDSLHNEGHSYIFMFNYGAGATFDKVRFSCANRDNNVSFIVSYGMSITMNRCHIVTNTHSRQGILWLMNRYSEQVDVTLTDSYFEHDAVDECMCFSMSKISKGVIPRCNIRAKVKDCTFYSPGQSRSSGFIIVYNHNTERYCDFNIQYDNCHFKARGQHSRYIQTYQCGKDSLNYGRFATTFNKCDFDFSFTEALDRGSVSLLRMKNAIPKEDISYTFNRCNFKFHNVGCVIGDRDADRKGMYTFNRCEIKTDGRAFKKKYNQHQGDISVELKNTTCSSVDDRNLLTQKIALRKVIYPMKNF